MSAQKQSSKRRADLAMIHMAGKRLFGDVSKGGDGREDYAAWLEKLTGKRSSGALNEAERAAAVRVLRREGLLPNRARGGVGRGVEGQDRPTSAQWGRIAGLARSLGWSDGLEDMVMAGKRRRPIGRRSRRMTCKNALPKVSISNPSNVNKSAVPVSQISSIAAVSPTNPPPKPASAFRWIARPCSGQAR